MTPASHDTTIVVPTSDGAERVERCVRALRAQARESTTCVERLVVEDNGAQPIVLDVSPDPLAVDLHHHPEPGVSLARNRGLERSTTELVVFVDDDVLVRTGWLDALVAPFHDPAVVAVVGPVVLHCEPDRPSWLTTSLASWYSALDLGPDDRRLGASEHGWGANLAVRRRAALDVGGFDPSLGPGTGTFSDDTDLLDRLRAAGGEVAYASSAGVDHVVGPERLRLRWLAQRAYRQGWTDEVVHARAAPRPPRRRALAAARIVAHVPRAAPGAAWRAWKDPAARPGLAAEQIAIATQAAGRIRSLLRQTG